MTKSEYETKLNEQFSNLDIDSICVTLRYYQETTNLSSRIDVVKYYTESRIGTLVRKHFPKVFETQFNEENIKLST